MDKGIIIQIILITAGIIMMILSVGSLAKRKMADQICVAWGFVAIIFIVAGIVLRPNGWVNMMSPVGLLLLVIVGSCLFSGFYLMSSIISQYVRRNNELAMQVSLLNEEMYHVKKKLTEIENQSDDVEKAE